MNELLHVASLAGQIILESGGETYRVEETIVRICYSFKVDEAESFVSPTGIMVSICHEGKTYSLIRRISKRTVDLDKIDKVNSLSRKIQETPFTISEVKKELDYIQKSERYSNFIIILFSALGAGGFTFLFNGTIQDSASAFLIGLLIKTLSIKLGELNVNEFFINIVCGAIVAFLAIILVNINIASGLNETIIGSIMLLVPGLAITNAIRDTIAGDLLSGLTRGVEAFLIAIAIAVGTGSVLRLYLSIIGGV